MPDCRDLVKRIRDVAEETDRQAESLERRIEKAKNADLADEMDFNARERRRDAEFLRDLGDSIDRHGDGHPLVDEIARDARP